MSIEISLLYFNSMVIDSFKAKAIEKKQIKLHFLYVTGKQFYGSVLKALDLLKTP